MILLRETITNLITQAKEMPNALCSRIEICVSDNNSTDDTLKFLETLTYTSPIPLTFRRNSFNIGPELNYLKAVEMANGEFAWLLGSDDLISKGGLQWVIQFLEREKDNDILVLNYKNYISRGKKESEFNRDYKREEIVRFDTTIDAIKNVINEIGLISILCFRRSLWNIIDTPKEYFGYQYIHVYKILRMIKNNASIVRIMEPVLVRHLSMNDSLQKNYGSLNRWLFDLNGFHTIIGGLYTEDSTENFELNELILRKLFQPVPVALIIMSLNFKDRFRFFLNFLKIYKRHWRFYAVILPVFIFSPGSHGKILGLFIVQELEIRLRSEQEE
jgi:abequosyltransferase